MGSSMRQILYAQTFMINVALNLLRAEISAFFQTQPGLISPVILANVAMLDQQGTGTSSVGDGVLLTLVNLEEESTFKNLPAAQKTINGGVRYANPPAFLNLYLLFCANFPITQYENALLHLSSVIRFFQGRRVFKVSNSPAFNLPDDTPDAEDLELYLNMYTMTFEQINHLWGSLGGKQMPFVMYKARLVRIMDQMPLREGALIEEINRTETAI